MRFFFFYAKSFNIACIFFSLDVIAEEIKTLFPKLFGQPSARLVECDPKACSMENKSLKIGVVLSGGQAPGGHNVISGIFGRGLCFYFFYFFFNFYVHSYLKG